MTEAAVTPHEVAATAQLAGLRLSDERLAAVAGLLSAWVPAANALSRRMQVGELDGLSPSVGFTQPALDSEETTQ